MSPESAVSAFIVAMNAWEKSSYLAERAARATPSPHSFLAEVAARLERVLAQYTVPGTQRAATYQRPPEYDPAAERILRAGGSNETAWVETDRKATLGGGLRRYALRRVDARWLIEDVRFNQAGRWEVCEFQ